MASVSPDKDANSLKGRDLLSINELTKGQIGAVLSRANDMLDSLRSHSGLDSLQNMIMATLFYEPSTRTRLSFESAMQRLGGGVIGFSDPATSSTMKGEDLPDTIKVVSSYSDIIVLRHPEEGAAAIAAEYSDVPVINAGDGVGQHPTQALLDLFTISKEKGKISGLDVAMVGDLKNGRTVHSLAYALSMFGNHITFISPKQLAAPDKILSDLNREGAGIRSSESLDDAANADVIYMTRIQKERFNDVDEYRRFSNYYTIDEKFLNRAKEDVIVMHPLPRLTEISKKIDGTRNSAYFRQAAYGVPVRMAILDMIMNR